MLKQLIPVVNLYAVVLAVWFGLRRRLGRMGFYVLFAVTVTSSVQLVGIYLVFASLILPALATKALPDARAMVIAFAVGAAGYFLGVVCPLCSICPPALSSCGPWQCWLSSPPPRYAA